jgi:membrane-associated phospholipid phosphatase
VLTTSRGDRGALLAGAVAALVFVASAAVAIRSPHVAGERILTWVAEHRLTGVTKFSELFAFIGSWIVMLPLAVLSVALLLGTGRRRAALLVGLSMTMEAILNPLLKSLFGLPRPGDDLALAHVSGYGFPSGHAMAAAALSVSLALVARQTRWWRPALIAAVVWTMLMGLSRVYLGVHWPSDVVGGWAAGVALTLGVCVLLGIDARSEAAGDEAT